MISIKLKHHSSWDLLHFVHVKYFFTTNIWRIVHIEQGIKNLQEKHLLTCPICHIMSCIVHVKPELYKWKDRIHKVYTDCKTEGTSQIVGLEFFPIKLKVTKPFGFNLSIDFIVAGGPLDFKWQGWSKILGGFKIFNSRLFFWVGNLASIFWVTWFKSRFWGVFFVLYQLMLSGNVWGSEIPHWIFWGLISGPFVVLLKALGIFFFFGGGVDFAPIRSSPSLGIWTTPPLPLFLGF